MASVLVKVLVAVVALTVIASAEPDDAPALVKAANQAFADLRYDDALRLLDRAWKRGDSGRQAMRAMFALAGEAAGSIGDNDNARLWFSRWLCIEPHAELPPGTSPKLTALFADARTALGGASIGGHVLRGEQRLAVVDPLALIEAARIGTVRVPIDAGAATFDTPIEQAVDLLDRYGNVLAVVEPETTPTVTVVSERGPLPWYERPTPWAIAAGSFAVIGAGSLWFAIDARSQIADLNRNSASHEFGEAHTLEQRFDRANVVGGVAIGGMIITAAVTTVLWLRGQREVAIVTPTSAVIAWRF